MTPKIRPLDPTADRGAVAALFLSAEDYIQLERGTAPGPEVTKEFFTDLPPGCSPAAVRKLGLEDRESGHLVGVADLAFGYPAATDAYLGLMVLSAPARGLGLGASFLAHVEMLARDGGARALYLSVLDANPRGRAFWQRQGFTLRYAGRRISLGGKTQTAARYGKTL